MKVGTWLWSLMIIPYWRAESSIYAMIATMQWSNIPTYRSVSSFISVWECYSWPSIRNDLACLLEMTPGGRCVPLPLDSSVCTIYVAIKYLWEIWSCKSPESIDRLRDKEGMHCRSAAIQSLNSYLVLWNLTHLHLSKGFQAASVALISSPKSISVRPHFIFNRCVELLDCWHPVCNSRHFQFRLEPYVV